MTVGLLVIGTILEYGAWTIGFGAVALARFNRPGRQHSSLPLRKAAGSLPGERNVRSPPAAQTLLDGCIPLLREWARRLLVASGIVDFVPKASQTIPGTSS